jgi:hypothetical protein
MREKHLLFSRNYLDKLVSGEKRATIRVRCPNLKPGDRALVHCGGRVVGEVEIVAVYKKKLRDITVDEALLDGFTSLQELRIQLKKHYPRINEDTRLCIIVFKWIHVYKDAVRDVDISWPYGVSFQEVAVKALQSLELDDYEKNVLELVAKTGSIRRAAYALGGLDQRFIVRDVLRRAARLLEEKGLLQKINANNEGKS